MQVLMQHNCTRITIVSHSFPPLARRAPTAAGARVYRIGTLEARGADMAPVIFENMTTSWPR